MKRTPEQKKKDFAKYIAWQQRSREKQLAKSHEPLTKHESKNPIRKRTQLKQRSTKRAREESVYSRRGLLFLESHRICPVTGERTTQIHHSAKREGSWLNLERYWIAVSAKAHAWIEDNKREAERLGLMLRFRHDCDTHINHLIEAGISLTRPVFYENWDGSILKPDL